MRHRRRAALVVLVGAAGLAGAAHAQSWGAPNRDFARYGVRTMVCAERAHAAPCLGLACRGGALALVNAAGGGGPMEGETRVSTGAGAFTLRFKFDPRALDRLGVAAASADLTAPQVETLLAATSLTLTLQADPRIRHRFSTRGLAGAWRRAAAACR